MTILLTADCVGGVWTYALDLARALPQHHFVLATMGALPSPAQQSAASSLPNVTLRASDGKLEWMESPWQDVAHAGDWLLELEREFAPDIVHLNGYAHAVWPFRAPKIVVAHSCVLSWWRAVKGEEAPAQWNPYLEKVGAGLRAADAVVAPTRAILEELNEIYGEFAPSQVIWNGAPAPQIAREAKESFVLSAGRLWDEAKNVALLAEVAPRLSAPIRVAGEGGELNAPNLELLGFLEPAAMQAQMRRAAMWAHPARYEPFGLAVLEAAQNGCALVLSDIPTLRELWNGAAHFAVPGDASAWVSALQGLLDSPNERAQWSQKARARASCYSLERFGAAYEVLYQEMATAS